MKLFFISTLVAVGLARVSAALVEESEASKANFKYLVGYETLTRFTTLSSTTFNTCITELGQNALCQGRRKRDAKAKLKNLMDADHVRDLLLDSSREEDPASASEDHSTSGKLLLTFTSFTTLTTTAYFDNTFTTVSISFHCIPPDGIHYSICSTII